MLETGEIVESQGNEILRELLDTTLRSTFFANSPRLQGLLRYLVEEEVSGRGGRLSVYGVAFDVFERNSTFDPQNNSLVRVEMLRLRVALQAWAIDPSNIASAAIEVKSGQYRPTVVQRAIADQIAVTAPRLAGVNIFGIKLQSPLAFALGAAMIGALMFGAWQWLRTSYEASCRSGQPELLMPAAD